MDNSFSSEKHVKKISESKKIRIINFRKMTALKSSLILSGFSENGPKTRQKMSDSQICQNRAKMTEIEMTDMCDYHQ